MSISKAEHDELCCVYAGLLLFDDKSEITAEKIQKIITASGNQVDAYYPEFFAKYLAGMNLEAFLSNVGSAPAGAPAATEHAKPDAKGADKGKDAKKPAEGKKDAKKDDKKEAKKEAKTEEPKDEEGEGEGFMNMFE